MVPATVRITGIDITTALLPHDPPSNVSFAQQSVLDLPHAWSNRFALAHQRLLTAAFGLVEWKADMKSLFGVIRPGGYLRMEEFMPQLVPPIDEATLPNTFRIMDYMTTVAKKRDLLLLSIDRLSEVIKEAGFANVKEETFELKLGPGEAHERARSNLQGVMRGMAPALASISKIRLSYGLQELTELQMSALKKGID